ncbi:hypothetical protein ACFSQT_15590 [Mesorhizobium calcicola]|uniref:Uncharacterized protein n=1 Tax=Mesorhizobium calcicola TaxID=1300310 RepID=A0ABW4WDE6_9HYPH
MKRPLQTRMTMAPTCTAARLALITAVPMPPKSCRKTEAKVSTATCGTQSRPMAIAMRQTSGLRSGVGRAGTMASLADVASSPIGGWRNQRHAKKRRDGGGIRPAGRRPLQSHASEASDGRAREPSPPPSGTAVCLMLHGEATLAFTKPGHDGAPLEPLTLPPSRPVTSSHGGQKRNPGDVCR